MQINRRTRQLAATAVAATLLLTGVGAAQEVGDTGHDASLAKIRSLLGVDLGARVAADGDTERAVPKARCGPGSAPETGLQGEVPQADRDSGRTVRPYTCNLERLNAPLGEGAGLQAAYYKHCAYYGSLGNGTRVIDVSDRRKPRISATLMTPAMLDPWESLKVHAGRGLLAAVEGSLDGPLFFDVYDIKGDCTKPVLKATLTVNAIGHEGEWSQDGLTYYASAAFPSLVTAIDVADPALPRLITSFVAESADASHGMSTNTAGTRLYLVDPTLEPDVKQPGVLIYDVSEIQKRTLGTQPTLVGSLHWPDGGFVQHTIPVSSRGKPYLFVVDESEYGTVRIVDISDERNPKTVTKILTEIQLTKNRTRADASGGTGFAYNMHYCNVDRLVEPTALACSTRKSGVRVFDIREVGQPREIAYWNNDGEMSAQVHLDPARGELWTTDNTHGLIVAKFTNGAWPLRTAAKPQVGRLPASAPAPVTVSPPTAPTAAPESLATTGTRAGFALTGATLLLAATALCLRRRRLASL